MDKYKLLLKKIISLLRINKFHLHINTMSHTITGSTNPQSFRDIHYLDGSLYTYDLQKESALSNEGKAKIMEGLINAVRERANPEIRTECIHALKVIQRSIGTSSNYTHADKLRAEDVFVAIADELVQVDDDEVINTVINHIAEQMSDLLRTNGWCSSGRVIRAMNIYTFIKDYNNKSYLPRNN